MPGRGDRDTRNTTNTPKEGFRMAATTKRASTIRKEQLARLTADVARAESAVAKAGERRLIAARELEARAECALAQLAGVTEGYESALSEAKTARDAAVEALKASLTGEVSADGGSDD